VKVSQFGELLKDAFPGYEVLDHYSWDASAQVYRIGHADKLTHRIYVSREFFDDHSAHAMSYLFREWEMAKTIRAGGARMVTVTNSGVHVMGATGTGRDRDRLRRLMQDLGDAAAAYQRGHGFLRIEHLPDEIDQLGTASYAHHAQAMREALNRKDDRTLLTELILVLAKLERERG
jgi:hypothetical protein